MGFPLASRGYRRSDVDALRARRASEREEGPPDGPGPDASSGEPPRVTKAVYRGNALKVTGEGFVAGATIAINGAPVGVPVAFKPAKGRLVVRASREALGLIPTPGANAVVVTVDGVASQPFAF